MKTIALPDGSELPFEEAASVLNRYMTRNAAAVELYDYTNPGPHDAIEAVDLLALNALNAFAGTSPMTAMEAMWHARGGMSGAVALITREPFEVIDEQALAAQRPRVNAALQALEKVDGYFRGGTRTAKLLHRLRPNVAPIWDVKIGEWYGGPRVSWDSFLSHAWGDIRRNQSALLLLRERLAPRLSIVRVWDALLWRRRLELE